MQWQEFREKLLCSSPISEIFAEKTIYLARLFKEKQEQLNGRDVLSLNRVQEMFEELSDIQLSVEGKVKHCLRISAADVQYAFGLSKMTVVDDNLHERSYFKLKFVEFFEFLGRVAHLATLIEIDGESEKEHSLDHRKPKRVGVDLEDKSLVSLHTLFEFLEAYFS